MKKFSKLLLALGGISAVGAGLAVGMVDNNVNTVEQTKAGTTDSVVIRGVVSGVSTDWDTNVATLQYNPTSSRWEATVTFAVGDLFKVVNVTANKWAGYHTGLGTTNLAGENGNIGDNIKVITAGEYHISVSDFSGFGNASYIFDGVTGSIDYGTLRGYLFASSNSWTKTYLYTFGGNSYYASFRGRNITSAYGTYGVTFNSNGLYRIPIYSGCTDNSFILSNDSNQTADLTMNFSRYYSTSSDVTGDAVLGAQASVAYAIADAVYQTTNYSVCNISKTVAQSLINQYDALSNHATIDDATIYTWKNNSRLDSEKLNVTFKDIVAKLRVTAASAAFVPSKTSDSSSTIVLGGLAAIAVLAAGGYFFVRKKKNA